MTDLAWLDATDQAALVRDGDVTPIELVDAAIARIEAVNPALNAVIHERFDRAHAEAADRPAADGPVPRRADRREGSRRHARRRAVPLRQPAAEGDRLHRRPRLVPHREARGAPAS